MRKILLLISDTHGGFKLALMPPDVVLFDETPEGDLFEYTPAMTAWQKHHWKTYMAGIEALKYFAKDDEILVLHNGDLTQGNKYKDNLVGTRMADQIIIATGNLSKLAELPNVQKMRIATGTEAHNFGENSSDLLVSANLTKLHPAKDISVVRHGMMTYNDLPVDYAHHGPGPGSRAWLRGNVARYYTQSLMLEDIEGGKEPPGLITRGHVHVPVDEVVKVGKRRSRFIITPSFSAIGDYANQAARSPSYVTNGMCAVEVIDGEICRVKEFYQTIDVRRRETL